MGCPSEVLVGDDIVFAITTHDPDTGVITDADAAPIYRIYEDETAIPILTGTMSKLDDANTTGFYTELISCTAANGFEAGKTYTIYIEATVDTDTGGISYAFKAKQKVDGYTIEQALQIVAAVVGGKISGAGTGTEVFVGLDGVTTRATVTVDAAGNRSVVTY